MTRRILIALAATAYIGSIILANWLIKRYGFVPVGFGLVAPAGVYAAGVSFTARDWLHELTGHWFVVGAILIGASISWFISPAFAVASGVAFLVSESADLAVYAPLRERRRYTALIASNTIGAVIDSLLFLWLAFGSVEFWKGQVVGKCWTIVPAIALLWCWRHYLSIRLRPRESSAGSRRDDDAEYGKSRAG
jgi:uncharacterized PurR-regulated membrane protein YhhQ (DUF165 family)